MSEDGFVTAKGEPLKESHHLRRHERGWWQLRFTPEQGGPFTNERILVALGTKDFSEAKRSRDAILRFCHKMQIPVRGVQLAGDQFDGLSDEQGSGETGA